MVGIYKITSPSNKIYIGQSKNLLIRLKYYKTLNCKKQTLIYRSLLKYGVDNHIFEIIKVLPDNILQVDIDKEERYYYDKYVELGFKMLNGIIPGEIGKCKHLQKTKYLLSKVQIERLINNPRPFKKRKRYNVPVFQYDSYGLVKEWLSSKVASEQTGIRQNSISKAAKGEIKHAGGFKWSRYKIEGEPWHF